MEGRRSRSRCRKRAGTFVTLRDVVEEVGADVTRFIMLTRKNDVALDFDFDKVLEQSKDNPVFYVQYANARVNSVLRKAREAGIDVSMTPRLLAADLAQLAHEAELATAEEDRRMAASGGNRRPQQRAASGGLLPL